MMKRQTVGRVRNRRDTNNQDPMITGGFKPVFADTFEAANHAPIAIGYCVTIGTRHKIPLFVLTSRSALFRYCSIDLKPLLNLTGRFSDEWKSLFDLCEDSPVHFENTPIEYLWDGSERRCNFEWYLLQYSSRFVALAEQFR
jgi:hypothetical protein